MPKLIENRQIRVFISSTFRDMQDERNYLMKRTFPKLRKLAAERDVTLTELDLRWGITEEEAESGKVVEICLREIENCIPFFIGIIGNRYGWVPKRGDLDKNVTERFKDVKNYLERHLSVTEMEMQFGVLQRKEDTHAYFYIKEGEDAANVDNPEMLERLKKEVKASRYPTSTYSSPENLAEQVEQAFIALLDQLFPEGNISELEKERIGQRAFMNQLCQNYIRDERNFKALDDWLHDADARQLVVTGASGLGKSALIANWLKEKLQDEKRNYNIIYHFTGNGGSECSHEFIKSILIDEINDVYGWTDQSDELKPKNEEKDDKLNDLFIKVASEGSKPLLIVVDAINQIVDTDNAKLLNWLPVPPKSVKILFSTLTDDRTMEVFKNRNYPLFRLKPLTIHQRRRLVNDYLFNQFAKKLSPKQVERIVTDSQCKNPLVLKSLLDELASFGIFEKLDERIEYYLSRDTIENFYQAVIQSHEEEFGKTLVKRFLSLIAISKKGMSEEELITISETKPLYWSQFYHLFTSHMVVKNGLVTFSHDYVRHAIETRYTKNVRWLKTCRKDIVAYFKNDESDRSYEELAFQYYNLKEFDSLYRLLLSIPVFIHLYNHQKYELAAYWRTLRSKGYAYEAIRESLLSAEQKDKQIYFDIISFFNNEMALYSFALLLSVEYESFLNSDKEKNNHDKLELYNSIGCIYYYLGDYPIAMEYCLKALSIREKVLGIEHLDTADSYNDLGLIYDNLGDYQKALKFCRKALKIREKVLGNHPDTSTSYNSIGCIYDSMGNFPKAIKYYRKALEIREKMLGTNHPDTATSYNNLGLFYDKLGDYQKAKGLCMKALMIREDVFGMNHPDTSVSYNNLGLLYHHMGNFPQAKDYYIKALEISEKCLGTEHTDTANSYNNLGGLYNEIGDYQKALDYYIKALKNREKVYGKEHPDTAQSYNNLGALYSDMGDYKNAIKNYIKALKIREKILGKEHPDTANSYNNIGFIYDNMGDYTKAKEHYIKALGIQEKVLGKDHPDTATTYNNIGFIFKEIGKYSKAKEYFSKALKIRIKVLGKEHADTANSYNNIGLLYNDMGDYQKALEFYFKALAIQEKVLGKAHAETASTYDNIGNVYSNLENYQSALEYTLKALETREKALGAKHPDTANSYNNIGAIYSKMGNGQKALAFCQKALKIREDVLGVEHPDTANSYSNIGFLYDELDDSQRALEYFFKALEIREKVLGKKHPNTIDIYNSIGNIYYNCNDYTNAQKYYFEVMEIRKKVLGADHIDTCQSYNDLGFVYYGMENYTEALAYFLKAKRTEEKVVGKENIDTAETYDNIGMVYYELEDYSKALEFELKALEISEKVLGKKHSRTAYFCNNINLIYRIMKDYPKALEYINKAYEIAERNDDIEAKATYLNSMGSTYADMGEIETARAKFQEALALLPEDHPEAVDSRKRLNDI